MFSSKSVKVRKKNISLAITIFMTAFLLVSCGSTKVLRQPHDSGAAIVFVSARGVARGIGVGEPRPKEPQPKEPEPEPDEFTKYGGSYQAQDESNGKLIALFLSDIIGSIGQLFHAKTAFAIKLENIETHEQFDSQFVKSSGYHNNVALIIPAGTYKVVSVGIALQIDIRERGYYYADSSEVSDFFGPLVIKPNCRYYLGTFDCYDEKINEGHYGICEMKYLDPASFINKSEAYIPKEINKEISKSDWEGGGFHVLRPASQNNVLNVSLINNTDITKYIAK